MSSEARLVETEQMLEKASVEKSQAGLAGLRQSWLFELCKQQHPEGRPGEGQDS